MKPPAYYRRKEQTYIKHFFLERYLETVAFHIAYTHEEFVYIDCFSGPWRSDDEELADTSIRIALDKLNYVHDALVARGRHPKMRAIFIEKDATAFRALEKALGRHSRSIQTVALHGTFEERIPEILQHVGRTFAFFFIDPKGWSGFAMDSIRPILRHRPGEVMVNFMYDFINRFINHPDTSTEQSLDRFFGTTDWRDIRKADDREAASVTKYVEQLRFVGGYAYVTSTRVLKPLSDRAYFHLVYATRSPKGILKFRDVEKQTVREQDSVRAIAQQEHRITKTGQAELAFQPAEELSSAIQGERRQRLDEARIRLFGILKHGSIPYEQLQPRILEIPLVWNTDLTSLLLMAQKDGQLIIDGMRQGERTPKKGCVIRAKA